MQCEFEEFHCFVLQLGMGGVQLRHGNVSVDECVVMVDRYLFDVVIPNLFEVQGHDAELRLDVFAAKVLDVQRGETSAKIHADSKDVFRTEHPFAS